MYVCVYFTLLYTPIFYTTVTSNIYFIYLYIN